MKTNFDDFENERMQNDPLNYKWGIFYFNPKDKRVIVPKRIKAFGWTLNFGNIRAYVILMLIVILALIISRIG